MCSHLPCASGIDGSKAAQHSRGIVKARRAHTGLRKLLARGGVWEVVKGKGKAVTAPPVWVWEGLAAHAPESAELACRAADASSAARYFEVFAAQNAHMPCSQYVIKLPALRYIRRAISRSKPECVWLGLVTLSARGYPSATATLRQGSKGKPCAIGKILLKLQIAQAPMGSRQASAAADNARLSLTTAAALAFQETRQIPGIDDSPVSISTDSPASAAFQGNVTLRKLQRKVTYQSDLQMD